MHDILSREFIALFPEYTRVLVLGYDLDNRGEHPELVAMLRAAEASVRADEGLRKDPAGHPRLASWRSAFRRFGGKPADNRPALEALVRRVLRGDELPYINTVVAAMNALSLRYLVPCGGDDVDRIVGDYGLFIATGEEVFTPFLGGEPEHPDPGEVILADQVRVMCRKWIWRQGNETKVTEDTRTVSIDVDVVPPCTVDEGKKAARELAYWLRTFCKGRTRIEILDKDHSEVEV
jgi:lysyl-tRNA synthetase class 2